MGRPTHPVNKSLADKREYRAVTLENELRVLLVSDPETDKSAAAMDVRVGHFSDPDDLPGLAHFCEHMLFLGTEKFPDENSYNVFLSENGGGSNAYTSMEDTNYYFDVAHTHLHGALDRFSQFFVAPLFTESATERELKAVDSENRKNLQDDRWRLFQLSKSTSNKAHPYSKFGTGNIVTLSDRPKEKGINTRDALLKFHQAYYSANTMTLCVLGRESLDTLEEWVGGLFGPLLNKSIEVPKFEGTPHLPEHMEQIIKVTPVKDERFIDLVFQLPSVLKSYLVKPDRYVTHLLGHEGKGSVLSVLKALGWANELSAGVGRSTTSFAFFSVSIELTVEGLERVRDVIQVVYQYIALLQKEGPKEWIYKEVQSMEQVNFRFKSKESPSSYCSSTASAMQLYEPLHYLDGGYAMESFNKELIQEMYDALRLNNCRIFLVSKGLEGNNEVEEWYQTAYSTAPLSDAERNAWSVVLANEALCLPDANAFIPTDLDMKPLPPNPSDDPIPSLVQDTPMLKVWHKQDTTFGLPKANVFISIATPVAYESVESCVLAALYVKLVEDSLNEFYYDASISGLSYSLANNLTGILLKVRGYNDKISVLLQKIVYTMNNLVVDDKRFHLIKEQVTRDFKNFYMEQPYHHALYNRSLLVEQTRWPAKDKIQAIEHITPADLRAFVPRLLRRVLVESLVHGNLAEEHAISLIDVIPATWGCSPLFAAELPERRVANLPAGSFKYHEKVANPEDMNNAVECYFQVGMENDADDIQLELLGQLMNEPCFDQLRTKEQLGYLVFSGLTSTHGIQGLRLIVQSPSFGAVHLDERIEAFLTGYSETLKAVTEEEFAANKASLEIKKLEKDKRLAHMTSRMWEEIKHHKFKFLRARTEAENLKAVTKEQVTAMFAKYISPESQQRSRLLSAMHGKGHDVPEKESEPVQRIDQPQQFRHSCQYFAMNC